MAHDITEVDSYDVAISTADDTDRRNAASILPTHQSLANRTHWLHARVNGSASASQRPISLSLLRPDQLNGITAAPFGWAVGAGAEWHQVDNGSQPILTADITSIVPPNVTVTGVQAYLTGNGGTSGAHSSLPATMPKLVFQQWGPGGNSTDFTDTQVDTAGSVSVYDNGHVITLATSRVVDPLNKRYVVTLYGEAGTNSHTNSVLYYNLSFSYTGFG